MTPLFNERRLCRLLASLRTERQVEGADGKLSREKRRERGVFFTPPTLAAFVADAAAQAVASVRTPGEGSVRVLDPAAGDGRFLLAAADALGRHGFATTLVALERDPALCESLAASIPEAEVRCCEALLGSGDLGVFDLVIGNPPYIRSIRLGETDPSLREALRNKFKATSHGEWDLYAAFLEQSLAWLSPNGFSALVVSSRWFTASFARELRSHLAEARALAGIVDFGAEQVFPGATTYSSVVFLSREGRDQLQVGRLADDSFDVGSVCSESLSGKPWRLSVGRGKRIVNSMSAAGAPLGSLARIVKGTGTNADRVYLSAAVFGVEAQLLRTCIRGRDVEAGGVPNPAVSCLVPYDDVGKLIEPAALESNYPRAAAYLETHRETLEAREGGRFRGPRFYQFGRPQNLVTLLGSREKIVVPDIARQGRAMIDRSGALVLDSAYAVIPNCGSDLDRIAAVLNSNAVALWLQETGIPLRGGYVRMKTAYLDSLPVPESTGDLRTAYGLEEAEWSGACRKVEGA